MILAPMVRIGTLPMRLLALKYGAHLVFTPELVDHSFQGARRITLGDFIEYHDAQGKVILRLHRQERPHLIVQLGSSNVERAVQAARMLREDCVGIDLNCGCPKKFSTHAGMGAALLETPDLLGDILQAMSEAVAPLPVSVKIRLLPQGVEATKRLLDRILHTGIQALSIHGRTRHDTYDTPCDWLAVAELVRHVRASKPELFVNLSGDVYSLEDADRAFAQVGVDGVLLARAAQWNVSVFSRHPRELLCIVKEYLELSRALQNHPSNTKYAVMEMLTKEPREYKPFLPQVYKSKSIEEMLACFDNTAGHKTIDKAEEGQVDSAYEGEDVEFGYTKERQEARMREKINKILLAP